MYTPELIAPAGNFEKLKIALKYGADAVYLGDSRFSLRAFAHNFGIEQLKAAVEYVHANNKKVFVTINVFAHTKDIIEIKEYLAILKNISIDGVVVSDPGVFSIVKQIAPNLRIHISTQANTTNLESVKFWEKLGASRIILARELTFDEIKYIRENSSIELEIFIHGAMCMSYSGRCMLSSFMTGRDANQGACAHPCRYRYQMLEEERPGQYFTIEEDKRGTYVLSSKDLCTIEHIHKFLEIGINGFKIEGRMKGIYYLAVVTKTYRDAISNYLNDPENYKFNPQWLSELESVSHREYASGFYFGDKLNLQTNNDFSYIQKYDMVGLVSDKLKNKNNYFHVEVRNKINKGDEIEILSPKNDKIIQKINEMYDLGWNVLNDANPNQHIILELNLNVDSGYIIRRKKES